MNHKPAFTLIETLAVVTLIGLAAVVLTPMLLGATDSSRIDDAMRRVLDLDARARLIAQRELGATFVIEDGVCSIVTDGVTGETRFSSWRHGSVTQIELRDEDGKQLERITYDASGRTLDFRVSVAWGSLSRVVDVAGLTGWIEPGADR